MKRKVIQIANSTQLVSLPRKWANLNNIKKGDEIELEEKGSKLILHIEKTPKSMSTEIDIKSNEHYLKYIFHGLYKRGYDKVILKYDDSKIIEDIQAKLHDEIIGFEIVEQRPKYCIIKSIVAANKEEFEVIVRRTFILLKTMSHELLEALDDLNPTTLKNMLHFEVTNNKYTSFCRRIINKGNYEHCEKATYAYCIVEALENLADEYKHLIKWLLKKNYNKKISSGVIKIYKELTDLIDEAYNTYYKFDIEKAISIFLKRKELIKKSYEIPCNEREKRITHYLINIAQKINDLIKFRLEMEL